MWYNTGYAIIRAWHREDYIRAMRYEGAIYRPPSEANSFILQTTIGCSHNNCIFCCSYSAKKFRERELEEIFADIDEVSARYRGLDRVFLADGDAMAMDTGKLLTILGKLYESFPVLERVSLYSTPRDLLRKSPDELERLRDAGLGIVYLGVETGNDELLRWIRKGVTRAELAEAGVKAREAGLIVSVTVINGLGGRENMIAHARDTASLINDIDPHYLGLLTIMVVEGTPIYEMVQRKEYQVPSPMEIISEIRLMVEGLDVSNCIFRANHASNYLPLKATLPGDKQKLLDALDDMTGGGASAVRLRPEYMRGL